MNVATLASSVLVQYALVSVTGNEWKYIGGVPLEGEALIKQTASAVDSNMNGLGCNPCSQRVALDLLGGKYCQDIFQISGEHIRFSTVPLGIVCGKQDRSTVRECVFNAGNSLVDCKANAIFDFHTEDKPNPCRNTSLLIEYKEALPKHPGSCIPTKMEFNLSFRGKPDTKSKLIVTQGPGIKEELGDRRCEVSLPPFHQEFQKHQWVDLELDNSDCEYFFAVPRLDMQYIVQSAFAKEKTAPVIEGLRFLLDAQLRTLHKTEAHRVWVPHLQMFVKTQIFTIKGYQMVLDD
ncbi:uncharacterized protein LOC142348296 [Convolutriloba macropyga]|uniref:uncharacterized protein LOC142348296 n=1 Tax=Convolutriloba macropyga TaxID=536237 RepID=UPI003F51D279